MKKIYLKESLEELIWCPPEVINSIYETIEVLNENYGEGRNVDYDLGGYILVAENIVDIEMLRKEKLRGIIPEYTDIIECKGGVNWTSSLFLISNDYSIVVVTTEELSKLLIEQEE